MILLIEAKKNEYVRTSTIEGTKKNSFLNYHRNEDKPKYLSSTIEGTKKSILPLTIKGTKKN